MIFSEEIEQILQKLIRKKKNPSIGFIDLLMKRRENGGIAQPDKMTPQRYKK